MATRKLPKMWRGRENLCAGKKNVMWRPRMKVFAISGCARSVV